MSASNASHRAPVVSVTEIMGEIREEINPTAVRRAEYLELLDRATICLPDLSHLESAVAAVSERAGEVGAMPPMPPTTRAKIGSVIVSLVRRALFWYTPQLHTFHRTVGMALEEQAAVTKQLLAELREIHAAIAELRAAAGLPGNKKAGMARGIRK